MAQSSNARGALVRSGVVMVKRLRGKTSTQASKLPTTALTAVGAKIKVFQATNIILNTYVGSMVYAPGYIGFPDGSVLRLWAGPNYWDRDPQTYIICAAAYTH
jgi:hypothetical protein